jgi:hypothetical protein
MMAKRIGLGETATSRRSAADTGSGRTAPEAAWRQTAISRRGVARARLPEQSAAMRPPCQSLARTPRARPRDQRSLPLAEAFRKNAVDPLSAIERIRGAFRAAGRVGSFTIPVYDGARRFDIVGKILPKQISSDGVLRAELTLRAIAGFKGETSEDGDPDDAPRKVELSVDEARMVPLSITVPVFSLPLVVQFQRLCAAPDPCTE